MKAIHAAPLLALLPAAGGPTASASAHLDLTANAPLVATMNGQAVRLLPMANGGLPILNPDVATRLGIRPSLFGAQGAIGPVRIQGRIGKVDLALAAASPARPVRQRVVWFDRPVAPGLDGAIGPSALPQPVVTFLLHAPRVDERRFVLPMVRGDSLGRLVTRVTIAGQPVSIGFDLTREATLATAAAGADLAAAHGGALTGAAFPQPIRMGVERPARRLALATPFVLGPLHLGEVVTRVADFGDASRIADADADPGEIVVVAGRGRVKAIHDVQIGRAALARCSSLTFDKVRMEIVLSCTPG